MRELPAVLPVALLLEGRRCLVVGGGEIAARKVGTLRDAGARVTVVAPTVTGELADRAEVDDALQWRAKRYDPTDLDGVLLVITATGQHDVDGAVAHDAAERSLFVNSADDPEHCSVFLTAVVRRGPVTVSISTSGAAPALASYLRRRLDAELDEALGAAADVLHEVRQELHRRGVRTESLDWSTVVNDQLLVDAASTTRHELVDQVLGRLA